MKLKQCTKYDLTAVFSLPIKQLASLETSSQKGPNFHRLQIYDKCLAEIIAESRTFGPLLQRIKVSLLRVLETV